MEKNLSSIVSTVYKSSYTENILQTAREHGSGNATGYIKIQNTAVNTISK